MNMNSMRRLYYIKLLLLFLPHNHRLSVEKFKIVKKQARIPSIVAIIVCYYSEHPLVSEIYLVYNC